jgi:exodeoxyribonuclease V alpha subunit
MGRGSDEDSPAGGAPITERKEKNPPFPFTIERIMFPKKGGEDTAYTIARGRNEDTGEDITCKGAYGPVVEGQMIQITSWKKRSDQRFGDFVQVFRSQHSDPITRKAIQDYLETLPGIGQALSRVILDRFGEDALQEIDRDPEILRSIESSGHGLSEDDLDSIISSWEDMRRERKTLIYLSSLGIGNASAHKIIALLGSKTEEMIGKNPYVIASVPGVSFKTADILARKRGIGVDDPRRLGAGIEYILQNAESDGHICLTMDDILTLSPRILGSSNQKNLEKGLRDLVEEGRLWEEKGPDGTMRIYTSEHFLIETRLYEALGERLSALPDKPPKLDKNPLVTDEQWGACEKAFTEKMSILTGGPGTGKTFTLKTAIDELEKEGASVTCLAPTGKAAKRMEETTGREASTIHRALGFEGLRPPSMHEAGEAAPIITSDVVIVDEASMLDMRIAERLLSAIKPESRLLLVGDPDQLPAVGAGSVLHDLIESERVPVTRLSKIFRQGESSLLVINAHRIRKGEEPYWTKEEAETDLGHAVRDDWRFIETKDQDMASESVRLTRNLSEEMGVVHKEVMVTTARKSGTSGTMTLNERMQEEYNPNGLLVREGKQPLRVGDAVMNTENRYARRPGESDIMNGDQGEIVRFERGTVWVRFPDVGEVPFSKDEADALIPSYAATTHKLQGSEFPAVVVAVARDGGKLLSRNMIYTAQTRGKEMCVILGEKATIKKALKVNGTLRKTTLDLRVNRIAPRVRERWERARKRGIVIKSGSKSLLF